MFQVTISEFEAALVDLGYKPEDYRGKKITLPTVEKTYGLKEELLLEAISQKQIAAHYDYIGDVIWLDSLDVAHFYYCVVSKPQM